MVRFIDNFSGGNRGAASAEYFLQHGYVVIFLHRKRSIMPFHRHFLRDNEHPLDRLVMDGDKVGVDQDHPTHLKEIFLRYKQVQQEKSLLFIPFLSIFDYFYWMRVIAQQISKLGRRVMFYSAAAVSDFYVKQQAEHKIQSSKGAIAIQLDLVPKLIPLMKPLWTPDCMVVTFKLETDEKILDEKVGVHIGYGVDMVIANILGQHTNKVIVCQANTDKCPITRSQQEQDDKVDLEKALINEISKRHDQYMAQK